MEHAAEEDRRVDALPYLVERELDELVLRAEAPRLVELSAPRAFLERVGRNRQLAAEGEPGVDVVPLAEPADLGHAPGGREAELEGVAVAEPPGQLADRTPVPVREPAVATARPAPADVLFQQDDVDAGIALFQEVGRPHAGVAAAEDDDVGGRVRRERRTRLTRIPRERFIHPPPARGSRWRVDRHGVHRLPRSGGYPTTGHRR